MTRMGTDAPDLAAPFVKFGFTVARLGIFTKPTIHAELRFWGAASKDHSTNLISLGIIAPHLNKVALNRYKYANNISNKLPYSPSISPPLLICVHEYVDNINYQIKSEELIRVFLHKSEGFDQKHWINISINSNPYGNSQRITIPAYFFINKMIDDLLEYYRKIKLYHQNDLTIEYIAYIENLIRELDI